MPTVLVAILLFLIGILFIFIVLVSHGALVWSAGQVEKQRPLSLSQAFDAGWKKFGQLLLVYGLSWVILSVIIAAIALPAANAFIRTGSASYNAIYQVTMFITLMPLAMIFSFIARYATAFIVLNEERVGPALRKAIALFGKHWLLTIEVGLLLFFINIILSMVLAIGLALLGLVSSGSGFAVFIVLMTAFGIFLATFQYHVWIRIFRSIEAGTVASKLMRMTNQSLLVMPSSKPK